MEDDPIFSPDELQYFPPDDFDVSCTMCGNPEAHYDEEREEYICDACVKRTEEAWKHAYAKSEQAIADAFNRAVDEHIQIDERRRQRR